MESRQGERAVQVLLVLILVVGIALRIVHLGTHRFHVDEALFASYGLSIAFGNDPLLMKEAVDKPPLLFYLIALSFKTFGRSETAAAVPSLVASVGAIGLVYVLSRRFFGAATALVAAFLMAISPYNVAYAYTAFIDPTLVGLTLLAVVLAERGLLFPAGIAAGLLPALKVQGVLFWPLIGLTAVLGLATARHPARRWLAGALLFALGAALPLAGVWYWDSLRVGQRPFLELAAAHNPLVLSDPATYAARLADWWKSSLQFMAGSPLTNGLLLAGVPLLLVWDLGALVSGRGPRRAALFDWLLAVFIAFFLGWHTYFDTPAWDRYMLGVVPFGLILLARVLVLPLRAWRALGPKGKIAPRTVWPLATAVAVCLAIAVPAPVLAGLRSTDPIGWAGKGGPSSYLGIEDVEAYLRANAKGEALLYDYQELSWHYKYYLFGLPYKVVWFDDKLIPSFQQRVRATPATQEQYIVLPDWVDGWQLRYKLAGESVKFAEVFRAHRPDGRVSFTIYRLTSAAR
ncbi:MAG: ArnT family glycosyltransferase [Chloroflexota bacterium]